ncbi:MAG: DNA ligase [Rhodoferax sp.]|uniref:DNA ligase n=1 Tax=Rhodoferax sp. TaxID=50421 RepID=UPI0008D00189|nr:DNA ligase [Rhodoferax sp.]MDP2680275.1 DNA ligase [Rhodoferax sp.]OGB51241.1 MAG: DNA ligase [Burkholderiales bacterium RIFOXYD12_FULL_59_19]
MKKRQFSWRLTPVCVLLGGVWATGAWAASAPVAAQAPALAANAAAQPALMHAKLWPSGLDPKPYLVSEKLDGVRAFWDGQYLRFRSGLPIAAPDWFTAGLPKTPLDGELWLGRGRFDELSGTVRKKLPVEAEWRQLRYMIFDLPGATGSFAERARRINTLLTEAHQPWLQAVAQTQIPKTADLQALLKQTVKEGGEGLVLHRANALWSPGRSDALRKLKPMPDEEARVIAHLPGKGRHAGRMGALLLVLPDGQQFALGTGFSDAQRADPPPVGAVVTYRYRDRTPRGLPRFASFLRVQPQ